MKRYPLQCGERHRDLQAAPLCLRPTRCYTLGKTLQRRIMRMYRFTTLLLCLVLTLLVGACAPASAPPAAAPEAPPAAAPEAPPAAAPAAPPAAAPAAPPAAAPAAPPVVTPAAPAAPAVPTATAAPPTGGQPSSLPVVAKAPDIQASTWINSEPLSLQQLEGKVALVVFWTYT